MTASRALAASVAVLALAAAGCGSSSKSSSSANNASTGVNPNNKEASPPGDIPDNQAYVRYRPTGGSYSVKVPEGWARTSSGNAVVFTDKLNTIRMETGAAPSAQAAQKLGRVSTVHRTAGDATRIVYAGTSKANPVTGKVHDEAVERYVFPHGGKAVILTLSGPKGADNVDPWRIVTDSVRFTR
jgi:hypothetical protein